MQPYTRQTVLMCNYLKSKLTGEALEAVAGYQLTNKNNPIVIYVLKNKVGNKQLIIDALYSSLHTFLQ